MVIVILISFITIPLIAVPSLFDSFFFFSLEGKPQGLETLSVLLPIGSPAPKTVLSIQRQ